MRLARKKILIADEDSALLKSIKQARLKSNYHFETAKSGSECLKKLETFCPDLVVIDLMLPQIHGIEILKKIKADPRTKNVGVIITSGYVMIQNHHAAIREGAHYFLEKPYELSFLFGLFKLFFLGQLRPAPFAGKESIADAAKQCYLPKSRSKSSYIKFWGTRGSNPVSGPEYVRFGGNTPCLEIRDGKDLLIIDSGTGIRPLGNTINCDKPQTLHLLLSHTHLDHIHAFPFFSPIYDTATKLHIYAPIGYEKSAREIFTNMLAYSYFPVRLDDIQAQLTFEELQEGQSFNVGNIEINTHYAFHPGATLCFKIRCKNKLFGYATDNEFLMGYHGNPQAIGKSHPLLEPYQSQIKFFKGCDFLVHEAQYTPIEYQKKVGWGHSSICNATVLVKHCEIDEWIITHHDPKHSDDDLLHKAQMQYDILDECKINCRTRLAFDGLVLPL